jgi:hypothetical protein
MLQEYVLNLSSVSDVCCSKYFMLQMFHEQAQAEMVPAGTLVPVCGKAKRTR